MERNESSKQQFDKAAAHYYDVLKLGFIEEVDKATNKLYAYLHCRKVFFERNQFIPYYSAFFQNLKAAYVHFFNMNEANSIEETLNYLPTIREISTRMIQECESGKLPDLYADLIEHEGCSLEEILAMEQGALTLDEENTIAVLAMYHATQTLLRDLPEFYPLQQFKDREHMHFFTRSQQVLFAYYLFQLAGIDPRVNADITTCAKLLHGFSGVPYNEIKNSEFYKKFRDPLNADKKTALTDLQLVRSYFVKLNRDDALELIDKDISGLK